MGTPSGGAQHSRAKCWTGVSGNATPLGEKLLTAFILLRSCHRMPNFWFLVAGRPFSVYVMNSGAILHGPGGHGFCIGQHLVQFV